LLKSPVRENRTPGSVRGPLGNWRSYRDGRFIDERESKSPSRLERFFAILWLASLARFTFQRSRVTAQETKGKLKVIFVGEEAEGSRGIVDAA